MMGTENSIRLSRGASIWVLFLLASLHLCAELGHFLIGVVSKYVARDIHYGTQACYQKNAGSVHAPPVSLNVSVCDAKTRESCESILGEDGSKICHWDWTGLGGEYQFLAGPSFMAMFTLASIVWGILADKYDRTNILFGSSILFSLALTFTSVATKFWHLVVLRMVLAAGVAGIAPIAPGIIFDMFNENERALAMGFFHWGIYLGNGLTFVVGRYITEMNLFNAGWRSTFVICGLPGTLLAILVILTVEDPPKSGRKSNTPGISKQQSSSSGINTSHLHHHSLAPAIEENDNDETEAVEDCCDIIDEAEVLISGTEESQATRRTKSAHLHTASGRRSMVRPCYIQSVVYLLGLGACIRHSAGFAWSYNSALYFQHYFPWYGATSMWLTWITILGGSFGVIMGGFVSDKLVSKLGIASRALVLAVSQIIAAPFALGVLYLSPPYAFISLFVAYLFAEMWYGVVFAILVELLPTSYRSLGLAIALFVVNNVGGNLPIIVTPLTSAFGFRTALNILYPGALFASSLLFFLAYIALLKK